MWWKKPVDRAMVVVFCWLEPVKMDVNKCEDVIVRGRKDEFEYDGRWEHRDVACGQQRGEGGQTAAYKRFYVSDETRHKQVHDPIPRIACPAFCRNGVAATRTSNVIGASSESRDASRCYDADPPALLGCWVSGLALVTARHCAGEPSDRAAWTNHNKASAACFLFSAARVIGSYDVLMVLQLAQVASRTWHAEAGVLAGSAVPCFQRGIRLFGHRTCCRSPVTAHNPSLGIRSN